MGKTDYDIFSKAESDVTWKTTEEAFVTGQVVEAPDTLVTDSQGHVHYMSIRKAPLRDERGETSMVVGVIRDTTQRRLAEEALRESEARFRAIFLSSADGIVVYDRDYNYLYANRASIDLAGTTPDKVIGKNIHEGLGHTPDLIPLWMSRIDQVFETGEPMHLEEASPLGGGLAHREYTVSPVVDADDGHIFAVAVVTRDVTERKLAEDALKALVEAGLALSSTLDMDRILDYVTRVALKHLGVETAGVYLREEDGETFRFAAFCSTDDQLKPFRSIGDSVRREDFGTSAQALETGRPIALDDYLAADLLPPEILSAARERDIRSYMVVPLIAGEKPLGVLQLEAIGKPHRFTPQEIDLCMSLVHKAAMAVRNAQLHQKEQEQRTLAEALAEVSRVVNSTLDLDEVLDLILKRAEGLISYDGAAITLITPTEVRFLAARGLDGREDELKGVVIPRTMRIHEAGNELEPILIADVREDPRWTSLPVLEPTRSYLNMPLTFRGKLIGELGLYKWEVGAYTERHVRILSRLADQTAVAIQNARLFQEEQEQRTLAEVMAKVSSLVNSTLDLDEVLDLILEKAQELIPSHGAAVTSVTEEGVRYLAVQGFDNRAEKMKDTVLPLPWGWREGEADSQTFLVPDVQKEPRWVSIPEVEHLHSFLNVPLISQGKLIGELNLYNREVDAFHQRHAQILTRLADQVATAIENARLYAEIQQELAERKRAEKAVWEERDRAERYLDVAGVMMVAIDADQKVSMINMRGCEILGYEEREVVGQNWFDTFVSERDRDEVKAYFDKLMAGEVELVERFEKCVLNKSGEERLIAWHDTLIRGDEGRFVGTLSSGEDITDRRRLEEQLRQAAKMDAIGRLAGGVAHDFNNELTAVIGYSDLILRRLEPDDPNRNEIEQIRKAGERSASLTRQLLAFSRRQILEPSILSLNLVIGDMQKMLRRILGEDIELITALAQDLNAVKADQGQMEQIIMNLTVNARQAMSSGDRLTLETANVELDEEYCREHMGASPGAHVMLAVSDTGCGMTQEVQSHLFEPFFTTKEEGTGLGLSTIYGIVKQHGGNVWCYSEEGQGTTFKVYLPRAHEPAEPAPTQRAAQELPRGAETVLVVEDQEPVRAITVRTLEDLGYTVIQAGEGEEALALCEHHTGPIHLMLTDVVMPRMGGKELADRLHQIRPELLVLFMSGYTDDAIVDHGILQEGIDFIHKPFTSEVLARRVREALDR